jgi:hypothetical protein
MDAKGEGFHFFGVAPKCQVDNPDVFAPKLLAAI